MNHLSVTVYKKHHQPFRPPAEERYHKWDSCRIKFLQKQMVFSMKKKPSVPFFVIFQIDKLSSTDITEAVAVRPPRELIGPNHCGSAH